MEKIIASLASEAFIPMAWMELLACLSNIIHRDRHVYKEVSQ